MIATPEGRPPSALQPPGDQEWILTPAAARILGCNRRALPGLAARGLVRRRAIPGSMPRYSRSDCEELARRVTTDATTLAAVGTGVEQSQ